nr:MAG TPA_asm: hypothetical protein [Bacteriophage sp.]
MPSLALVVFPVVYACIQDDHVDAPMPLTASVPLLPI